MAFTKEYAAKVILSLDGVRKTERAQREIYDKGIVSPTDSSTLADALSASATILGLVFLKSTAVGLATAVLGIVTDLIPNEKEILKEMVYDGYWHLGYLEDFLVDNPNFDLLEVNFPFIEYETAGVRFITGNGVVTRVHSKSGGWQIL
ncbi:MULTISPECIES: hypothetical protein [Paenibacillus]|uniref:Uncharacterized protein n=1 Tax=Paenibacillus barengoltzii G22 TaxID=1235795 RepID=R9L8R5_9BACL|nr:MULTISPECIES: hypothetical protein [Paenibacillus]EES73417.1 hypothetical protein POTG_01712 [Paenibacillus sp. oral taxon 786 str. D14]EOS55095.1 hypothetical protein C812_03062 [Paenibacillus barengoltzii G22]